MRLLLMTGRQENDSSPPSEQTSKTAELEAPQLRIFAENQGGAINSTHACRDVREVTAISNTH